MSRPSTRPWLEDPANRRLTMMRVFHWGIPLTYGAGINLLAWVWGSWDAATSSALVAVGVHCLAYAVLKGQRMFMFQFGLDAAAFGIACLVYRHYGWSGAWNAGVFLIALVATVSAWHYCWINPPK